LPLTLALDPSNSAARRLAANINAVLALAHSAVAHCVVVIPNQAEEIGANVLESIPVFGNGELWLASEFEVKRVTLWRPARPQVS